MEDQKLTFKNTAAAVAWAEEVLDKQGARSQLGRLMKFGFGELTADEARDLAHTIVMIVSGYSPRIQAEAFGYVYGRDDDHRERILTEDLAARMATRADELNVRRPNKEILRRLAIATLRSQREMYLFNRHNTMTRIARFIGMAPDTFRDKRLVWVDLYGLSRTTTRYWVDSATKGLDELLRERGFVV